MAILPILTIFVISFLIFFASGKNAGSISSIVMIAIISLSFLVLMEVRIQSLTSNNENMRSSWSFSGYTPYTEDLLQQDLLTYSYQEKIFNMLSSDVDDNAISFKEEMINSMQKNGKFDINLIKSMDYYSEIKDKIEKFVLNVYGSEDIQISSSYLSIPDDVYQNMSLVFKKINTSISKILSYSFNNWIIKTQLGHRYKFLIDDNYASENRTPDYKINISDLITWTYFYNIVNSFSSFEIGIKKEIVDSNNYKYSKISKMSNLNLELNPFSQLNSLIFGFDSNDNDFRSQFDTSLLGGLPIKNATVQGGLTYEKNSKGLYIIKSVNIKNKNKVPRIFISWLIVLLIFTGLNSFKFKKYIKY